jgi:hypothetical protein
LKYIYMKHYFARRRKIYNLGANSLFGPKLVL